MKEKMLWNVNRTQSVKQSKLREFEISRHAFIETGLEYRVVGWFDKKDFFSFGYFNTNEDALEFLKDLHEEIESCTNE